MKSIFLILGPIVLFAILLTGGFTFKDPQEVFPGVSPIAGNLVERGIVSAKNTLQIIALGPQSPTSGVTPPGVSPPPGGTTTPPAPVTPPAPGYSPSPSPSPSSSPSLCRGRRIAFDLLFDVSGSLGNLSIEMQRAARRLVSLLDDNVLVGAQEFSRQPRDLVNINTLRVNRPALINLVLGTQQGGTRDLTYMKDGFERARQRINQAQASNPGYTWYLVFFSDGVPNCNNYSLNLDPNCASDQGRGDDGPNPEQDPTQIANALKGSLTIWSIGYFQILQDTVNLNPNALAPYGYPNTDGALRRYAVDLMQNRIASAGYFREYTSLQSLESLYETIGRSVCP